tara:strand:- start:1379 stop:2089 length:711 start_codon:yes stop_codon:yes gene_type:complete
MIKELVKLANHLDSKGLVKEADYLDRIIKMADEYGTFGPMYEHQSSTGKIWNLPRTSRPGDPLNNDAPERGLLQRMDYGSLKLKPEIDDKLQRILIKYLEGKGLPVGEVESSEETHGYFLPLEYQRSLQIADKYDLPESETVGFINKKIIFKYPEGDYELVSSITSNMKNTPLDAATTTSINALFGGARTTQGGTNKYTINTSHDGYVDERTREVGLNFIVKRPFLAADIERFLQK